MAKVPTTWPTGCVPPLLRQENAAFYCGQLCPNKFLELVREGKAPAPILWFGFKVWRRWELDRWMGMGGKQDEPYYDDLPEPQA
jgi:hypothetical protein